MIYHDVQVTAHGQSSNEVNKLHTAGADIYRFTFTQCFYSRNGIGRIGYLSKQRMDQETKIQDNYAEVGSFQVTLTAPLKIVRQYYFGGSLNVAANTNGNIVIT
jgi:hypothetical protein